MFAASGGLGPKSREVYHPEGSPDETGGVASTLPMTLVTEDERCEQPYRVADLQEGCSLKVDVCLDLCREDGSEYARALFGWRGNKWLEGDRGRGCCGTGRAETCNTDRVPDWTLQCNNAQCIADS